MQKQESMGTFQTVTPKEAAPTRVMTFPCVITSLGAGEMAQLLKARLTTKYITGCDVKFLIK